MAGGPRPTPGRSSTSLTTGSSPTRSGPSAPLCRHFDYAFGPAFESKARAPLAANPRQKHGVHRYRLADFGLDAVTIEGHFAEYYDWLARNSIDVN